MCASSQIISLFDLDATLYKGETGYVIFDLPYYLEAVGLFNTYCLQKLEQLRTDYKHGIIDNRATFAHEAIRLFYHGLTEQNSETIKQSVEHFWDQRFDTSWYAYSLELVKLMNQHSKTILISGSPFIALQPIIKEERFKFSELHATKGLIENGRYTGKYHLDDERATPLAKRRLVQSMDFKSNLSFAFGDSESDVPTFEAVHHRNAFVFEPKGDLLTLVRSNNWQILEYDDDVVQIVKLRLAEVFDDM